MVFVAGDENLLRVGNTDRRFLSLTAIFSIKYATNSFSSLTTEDKISVASDKNRAVCPRLKISVWSKNLVNACEGSRRAPVADSWIFHHPIPFIKHPQLKPSAHSTIFFAGNRDRVFCRKRRKRIYSIFHIEDCLQRQNLLYLFPAHSKFS